MRSPETSSAAVKLYAPAWDRNRTDSHHQDIADMKTYFRDGDALGIGDEAIAEDLQKEFGHLGRISIKPRDHSATLDPTVWIVIEPYRD